MAEENNPVLVNYVLKFHDIASIFLHREIDIKILSKSALAKLYSRLWNRSEQK